MPSSAARRSASISMPPPSPPLSVTTGPRAAELERRMAEYLEAEHVLALASGTAALHLALVALGVGPGDEVITSPITWPATANVIVHAGAAPVFVDVREDDLNIDPALVA